MFDPWRVVQRREVLSIPERLTVAVETVELPDGRVVADYWQVRLSDYVVVFAETADARIVCLRQYRHGPRRVGLELVAGRIEANEPPLDAARRELLEESGYASLAWQPLGSLVVSATQGVATAHLFRARDAVRRQEPRSGDLEQSAVVLLPRDGIAAALREEQFMTASHVAAIGMAMLT